MTPPESPSLPPLDVRRARPEDLTAAAALAERLVRMHHDVDPGRFFLPDDVQRGYTHWFGRELKRPEAVVLVAARAEQVVGYAYGTREGRDWNALLDDYGALHDIYVAESERRLGTGRRLLDAIVAELEALGAARIVLCTMVSNTAAQRLFASAGFRSTMLEMTRGG
ncbi:MAG TPA: GNAT family N-acetyltransferase [Polyangiaceae bacterium]|nr:GNAT family N-acetyltransferase [Polyangiaceae bacterium]